MQSENVSGQQLLQNLRDCLGADRVTDDPARRRLLSTDFYAEGKTCVAVIRPADSASLARAAALVTGAGEARVPRGGGRS